MNQTVSAAETVFSAAHPDIKKSTSISSLILSVLLLAAGAALLFFSSKVDDSSSSSGPMLLVGGVALLATGGIRLLVGKKNLIYTPTGSIVKKDRAFSIRAACPNFGKCSKREPLTVKRRYGSRMTED